MSLFLKLFDETQIPTPPEATRHHNLKKLLIPLPLRADLLLSVHSETPCTYLIFSLLSVAANQCKKFSHKG